LDFNQVMETCSVPDLQETFPLIAAAFLSVGIISRVCYNIEESRTDPADSAYGEP